MHIHAAQAVDDGFAGRAGIARCQQGHPRQPQRGQWRALGEGIRAGKALALRMEWHGRLRPGLVIEKHLLEGLAGGDLRAGNHVSEFAGDIQIAAAVVAHVEHQVADAGRLEAAHGLDQLALGDIIVGVEGQIAHLARGRVDDALVLHGAGADLDGLQGGAQRHPTTAESQRVRALRCREQAGVDDLHAGRVRGIDEIDAVDGLQHVAAPQARQVGRRTRFDDRDHRLARWRVTRLRQQHAIAQFDAILRILPLCRWSREMELVLGLAGRRRGRCFQHVEIRDGRGEALRLVRGRHFAVPQIRFIDPAAHPRQFIEQGARLVDAAAAARCLAAVRHRGRSDQRRRPRRYGWRQGRDDGRTVAAAASAASTQHESEGNNEATKAQGMHEKLSIKKLSKNYNAFCQQALFSLTQKKWRPQAPLLPRHTQTITPRWPPRALPRRAAAASAR